jgi:hypothetical protein
MYVRKPVASPVAPTVPMAAFTADQWEALGRLRAGYPRQVEFFSPRELARLRFLRWLYRGGRLTL